MCSLRLSCVISTRYRRGTSEPLNSRPIMWYFGVLVICGFIVRSQCHPSIDSKVIPKQLLMGAASSSYQVEGAWNEDGKGENIWDRMAHSRPEKIDDRSNGDIACDAYHKIDEDVAIMRDMGLDFYRFSLSWSRILPTGFVNEINPLGIKYYNTLIDKVIANNITPVATIFHWDLPQPLQDLGGFTNPDIAMWMKEYARVVFEHFGDRVKTWITINEPKQICQFGFETGIFAPGITSGGTGVYICSHNLLKAHAQMYHLYDKVFRPKQKGRIGIVNECAWNEPATNSTADIEAADRRRQFDFGLYTHPIFHRDGDYPEIVKRMVAERSQLERFPTSRLPKFTREEVRFIKGTSDFFGLNHYTTVYVKDKAADPIGAPSQDKDSRVVYYLDDSWLTGAHFYFRLVPWGVTKILNYIKDTYDNPAILITESGFPDAKEFQDTDRIRFYKETIEAVLNAIYYDGVAVESYTAWCLMDNYEWSSGYTKRFGFYHVDFTHPNRTRTPKASAHFYKNLLQTRTL